MSRLRSHSLILLFYSALVVTSLVAYIVNQQLLARAAPQYFTSQAVVSEQARQLKFSIFPVQGTKAMIQLSEVGYNYNCKRRCHATYEAADIGGESNTPVYSLASGEILDVQQQSVAQGKTSGASLRMRTDDGWYVYFTHMAANSVRVRIGDRVGAGDIVGVIGTAEEAQGAPPHLHIDVGFRDNGFSRGANLCSDECRWLVAPQPLLRDAYNKLPER